MRRWKILIPATIIASLFTYFIAIGDADIKHGDPQEKEDQEGKPESLQQRGSNAEKWKARENGEMEESTKKPLTIHCNGGRLGNQISTYATLYGIARYNGRRPHGQHCNMKSLRPYFKVTMREIPDMAKEKYRSYDIARYLREEDLRIPPYVNILTGFLFPRSYTFYDKFKDEIRREFSFKDHISSYATSVLRNLNKKRRYKVYVGVHVRRTDFCILLKKYHARSFDMEYLTKAMDHFRRKYHDVVFVVVSDDRKWCHKNLKGVKDVVIAPSGGNAIHDFAVLVQCNHSIITHGSFGYWAAYLAGGETVYFTGNIAPNSPLFNQGGENNTLFFPPEWIGISTTPKDYWKTHKLGSC